MKIEEQVVSLKLAKELKEAGYPQEGLWWWSVLYYGLSNQRAVLVDEKQEDWQGDIASRECYVAPTVAELGERLPIALLVDKYNTRLVTWTCGKPKKYLLRYERVFKEDSYANIPLNSISDIKEANARAKMWLYLKKEKLI